MRLTPTGFWRLPFSALVVTGIVAALTITQQHPQTQLIEPDTAAGPDEECPRGPSTPQAPVSATRPAPGSGHVGAPAGDESGSIGDTDYSTLLGGTSNDFGIELAVDADGNTYVTGQTTSPDFPTTADAFDTTHNGMADAFVTKLDASGAIVYSTYLGGSNAEAGLGITVDDAGNAYVSGGSASPDFPVTAGAFDTTHNGFEDVFVAKLNPEGSEVLWATFLGGSQIAGDFAPGIAVDADGSVYVSGGSGSPDFPTTPGAYDTRLNGDDNVLDAFVAKLDPSGSELLYATFLGGKCKDAAIDLAIDDDGNVYVTGSTVSPDLPTTENAFRRRGHDGEDAFVAKLHAGGSGLEYATYVGGKGFDRAQSLALDERGRVFVTGWTDSPNFPTTEGALDDGHRGGEDAFVVALNAEGSDLVYSTYLGGRSDDRGRGVVVDPDGNAYVAGATASPNFPTTASALAEQHHGDEDGFVVKLNPKGSKLVYATYIGGSALDFARGIALDSSNNAHVTGRAESSDFATTGPPSTLNGTRDGFVLKIGPRGS
jgi:hypothetical protein